MWNPCNVWYNHQRIDMVSLNKKAQDKSNIDLLAQISHLDILHCDGVVPTRLSNSIQPTYKPHQEFPNSPLFIKNCNPLHFKMHTLNTSSLCMEGKVGGQPQVKEVLWSQ